MVIFSKKLPRPLGGWYIYVTREPPGVLRGLESEPKAVQGTPQVPCALGQGELLNYFKAGMSPPGPAPAAGLSECECSGAAHGEAECWSGALSFACVP